MARFQQRSHLRRGAPPLCPATLPDAVPIPINNQQSPSDIYFDLMILRVSQHNVKLILGLHSYKS